VSLDGKVIRQMEPGRRYEVTRIAAALGSDYSTIFFSLSRLCSFGFVQEHGGNEYSLTFIGEKLHKILTSAD